MDDRLVLLVFYSAASLLLIGLSVPLIQNKVRPNAWYGFRVPKTFASEDTWYAANQYAGKRLLWTGVSTLVAAMGLYLPAQLSLDAYALGVLAVFGIVLLIGLVQSFLYLRSL